MHLFPAFLRLQGRRCVVVGAGRVGLAKIESLLAAGADVTVVETSPSPQLTALEGRVRIHARPFAAGDTAGAVLVFACTDSGPVQEAVAADAAAAGALLCRADDAEAGDFSSAAVVRRGPVCVAVSSGGTSPALAAHARDAAAAAVGPEFERAAAILADVRERMGRLQATQAQRAEALRSVVGAGLVDLLRQGRDEEAERLAEDALARLGCATDRAKRDEEASEVDPCTA